MSKTPPTYVVQKCFSILPLSRLCPFVFGTRPFSFNAGSLASKNSFLTLHSCAFSGRYTVRFSPCYWCWKQTPRTWSAHVSCLKSPSKPQLRKNTRLLVSYPHDDDPWGMPRSPAITKMISRDAPRSQVFPHFVRGHPHRPSSIISSVTLSMQCVTVVTFCVCPITSSRTSVRM